MNKVVILNMDVIDEILNSDSVHFDKLSEIGAHPLVLDILLQCRHVSDEQCIVKHRDNSGQYPMVAQIEPGYWIPLDEHECSVGFDKTLEYWKSTIMQFKPEQE